MIKPSLMACFIEYSYKTLLSTDFRANPKPSFLNFWQGVREKGTDKIGLYNVLGMSHCNPQVRWIENIEMDFIGRYENLSEEIDRLMDRLRLPPLKMQHRNKSERKPLGEYYCPESKKVIEDFFAEDFEIFGYETEPDDRILGTG